MNQRPEYLNEECDSTMKLSCADLLTRGLRLLLFCVFGVFCDLQSHAQSEPTLERRLAEAQEDLLVLRRAAGIAG